MTLPRNVIHYGVEDPLPRQLPLRAGPLTMIYESGDLRYLRLGDREVIRRIYVAVRDRNWGTVPPKLANERIETGRDTFRITYEVEHRQGEIDFFWKGAITGEEDGTITFTMDGEARSTFLRNRIGFCILHPIREGAGARVIVEHPGGEREEGELPVFIAPDQPFLDMTAISHEVQPGVWAELRFTGDLFEMEDQRNWTDASYKTYCTPLSLGYPVEVQKGTKVRQSVTLRLKGETSVIESGLDSPLTLALDESHSTPLPALGLGVSSLGEPLSEAAAERLKALNLAHLRADLRLSDEAYPERLEQAMAEASAAGVPLEVALHLSDHAEEELSDLVHRLGDLRPSVRRWIVFHEEEKTTSEEWVRKARIHLTGFDPQARIGSGTDADFVDLNRDRPAVEVSDFINYPMSPQVHAFDNASLVETLEAQASTIRSAMQFVGEKPLVVSPVTLKRRFNPDATGPEPKPAPGELPAPVDPRQMSLFGAGWTFGSIKAIAETGAVESVTYYETTGWRGVMETGSGSPLPERFLSLPGSVFPVYHVFADLAEFAGGEVFRLTSSRPLEVEGLAVRRGDRLRLLLANFTDRDLSVTVSNVIGKAKIRSLDERNAEEAMKNPEAYRMQPRQEAEAEEGKLSLSLSPYAVVCLDSLAAKPVTEAHQEK